MDFWRKPFTIADVQASPFNVSESLSCLIVDVIYEPFNKFIENTLNEIFNYYTSPLLTFSVCETVYRLNCYLEVLAIEHGTSQYYLDVRNDCGTFVFQFIQNRRLIS